RRCSATSIAGSRTRSRRSCKRDHKDTNDEKEKNWFFSFSSFVSLWSLLQNELAQVLLLEDSAEALADVGGVDDDALARQVRTLEAHLLDHPLQHRVQPPGADVLRRPVHLVGHVRQRLDAVAGELHR